ncbi:MAG: hypothetical protein P8Y94_16355 [Acidobacteriota bacterium]
MNSSRKSIVTNAVRLTLLLSALSLNAYAAVESVTEISVPTILAGREDSGAVWYAQLEIIPSLSSRAGLRSSTPSDPTGRL